MKLTKNPLLYVVIIIILLDWAALDDITTGSEPEFWEEWDLLLYSFISLALLAYAHHKALQKWITKKLSKN